MAHGILFEVERTVEEGGQTVKRPVPGQAGLKPSPWPPLQSGAQARSSQRRASPSTEGPISASTRAW
jgi:hypothetical protein